MNRVPVIVRNPAFVEELEPDGDEVDPADLTPCIGGDTPIITSPASEDKEVVGDGVGDTIRDIEKLIQDIEDEYVEDIPQALREAIRNLEEMNQELRSLLSPGDTSPQEPTVVPDADIWDTGKAVEQEYKLYPDSTMEEIRDRLSNQVWDLLQILQEWVNQHTYNSKDIELISGLKTISVLNSRLSAMTTTVLKRSAEKPHV